MKDRKTLIYLILISIFLLSMMAMMISAEESTKINAKAYTLYNPETNFFLCGENINQKLPMASTTKIMTALIAIEELDPKEEIMITGQAVGVEGSSLYLAEGDIITVRDLIYSVLLQSANDASVALAMRIGGSIDAFAEKMNERAKLIGATDTNFKNPHGLDESDHYTTAKDLALIAAAALKNETFREITSTYKYSFTMGDKTRILVNHNKLLKQYDGCIGIKTGYTKKCGRCLVSAAYKDGITLIAVTLCAPDDWRNHKSLLNYGFDTLETTDVLKEAKIPDSLPVLAGNKNSLKIGVADSDKYVVRMKNAKKPEISVNLRPYVIKSAGRGDVLGQITIKDENDTRIINIIALEDVKSKSNNFPFFAKTGDKYGKNKTSKIYG